MPTTYTFTLRSGVVLQDAAVYVDGVRYGVDELLAAGSGSIITTDEGLQAALRQLSTTGGPVFDVNGVPGGTVTPVVIDGVFLANDVLSKRNGLGAITPVSVGSGGAAATLVAAGNLGATRTQVVAANSTTRLTGTLNANHVLTFTGSAGSLLEVRGKQDATGGRSFTVTDGTSTYAAPIPTGAGAAFEVFVYSDGTDIFVSSNGTGGAAATAPGQVTGLGATPGNGQAVLAWTAPANGGSAITDYVVEFRTGAAAFAVFSDGVSTATGATVTGLTNGTAYDFRVSAVNAVGPGAVSATVSATPTVSGSVFVLDNFNGAAGTLLQAHSPDTGGAWSKQEGLTSDYAIDGAGGLYLPGGTDARTYWNAATPASAEYDVEVQFTRLGTAAASGGGDIILLARRTGTATFGDGYGARINFSAATVTLFKEPTTGGATQIGSAAKTWTVGTVYVVKLQVRNATKKVFVDGVEVISSTDNSNTGVGKAGLSGAPNNAGVSSATIGPLIDSFKATNA